RPLLVLDVRLGEGRLAQGAPERRALAPIEEAFRPEFEEDRLAVRPVLVGVRIVRVREVRGHPDPRRELEQAIANRLDLLAALRDERLAVPFVERLAGLLLVRALDVDPGPVYAEREQERAAVQDRPASRSC